ncbi:Iron-containing alcohol dehydrogenase [Candidatus Magnetoovum chiemensis]|nr:Iron-containing alcohol dehydrogenase [Candidatus Magnetoovum chiemensis]
MINTYTFYRTPHLYFGSGWFRDIAKIAAQKGKTALIVTGKESLIMSDFWDILIRGLNADNIKHYHYTVSSEPTAEIIDTAVNDLAAKSIDVIVSVGGGSVIDAGKAISAMLALEEPVFDYLEDVGSKKHSGQKIPFIAVPTTSGTGSEATTNAVISKIGKDGFKRSLRHDAFVPDIAIIDPLLTLSCPPDITAYCAMDSFTQLLESYVSTKASPITDALAINSIETLCNNLLPACTTGSSNLIIRSNMSYSSFISGITLTNAGLGVVHGFASSIGALINIPHGALCATLLAQATKINIEALTKNRNTAALEKYAKVGSFFTPSKDTKTRLRSLIETLQQWTDTLEIPRLKHFGLMEKDINLIAETTSIKNNPADLTKDDLLEILKPRL